MPLSFQKVELPDFNDTVGKEFLEACGRGDLVTVQESPKLSDGVWRSNGLEDAANGDQPVMMEFLLEKGAIIQTWTVDAARSQGAWEALLKNGLDVNNPMPQARVPLMAVVAKNDPTLLRWYLSLGADPNLGPPQSSLRDKGFVDKNDLPSSDSSGALAQAIINCGTDIVDILIEHGANLEKGLALHRALKRQPGDRIPMMEYLLHLGIDINHFGWTLPLKYGGTALHLAACTGQIEETRWLLESGADPTISNSAKMTPDAYALLNRYETVARLILEWKDRNLD